MSVKKERRVALVVGNAVYKHAGMLKNPGNDAKAISAALARLGFSGATPKHNLDYNILRRALQDFAKDADSADMAVIYFAGHGIEVDGRNFLIPVDAKLERSKDVEFETASLDQALSSVDGARHLRLIILDACRNNPFRARLLRSGGTRSIGQGLRSIEPGGNVLVAYAAKHGTFALDGTGDNSPFALALRDHIEKPGLEIGQLFREVRDDVLERTGREQEPHIYGTLGREGIYLKPLPPGGPAQPNTSSLPEDRAPKGSAGNGSNSHPLVVAGLAGLGAAVIALTAALIFIPTSREDPRCTEQKWQHAERKSNIEALRQIAGDCAGDAYGILARGELEKLHDAKREKGRDVKTEADNGKKDDENFKDCAACPEMVVVPANIFTMGSPDGEEGRSGDEGPRREVAIAKLAVGRFEVTFAQWDACVGDGGCKYRPEDDWGRGSQPVTRVSWNDITNEYLPWLNRKTGKTYRLLTEAEWEYVVRAGTQTRYSFGDDVSQLSEYGWYSANSGGKTHPVGGRKPNAWGLRDMHGNVWEWVQDCWNDSYKGAPTEGKAWTAGDCSRHVLRGGSWDNSPQSLRSAFRGGNSAGYRYYYNGFRVARTLNPKS